MFKTWKEFMGIYHPDGQDDSVCVSCGTEDFDLLCKEKDEAGEAFTAIFICKNCGAQKKVAYAELETS